MEVRVFGNIDLYSASFFLDPRIRGSRGISRDGHAAGEGVRFHVGGSALHIDGAAASVRRRPRPPGFGPFEWNRRGHFRAHRPYRPENGDGSLGCSKRSSHQASPMLNGFGRCRSELVSCMRFCSEIPRLLHESSRITRIGLSRDRAPPWISCDAQDKPWRLLPLFRQPTGMV